MQASWPLRFISENVSDMTNVRSMLSRQASDAVDTTADGGVSESVEDEFFDSAFPDSKSEASQYYDADSEGELSGLDKCNLILNGAAVELAIYACSSW